MSDRGDPRGDKRPAERLERRLCDERAAVFERSLSSVGHAIGSPLQVISGRASLIKMDAQDEETQRSATIIQEKAAEVTAIVQRVLGFARAEAGAAQQVPLNDVVREVVEASQDLAALNKVELAVDEAKEGPSVPLRRVRQLLEDLLSHVVLHAEGATVSVVAAAATVAPPEGIGIAERRCAQVRILVRGARVEPLDVPRPYEPWLFDPPPEHRDTVLRLSIVYGIVRHFGGWVDWSPGDHQTEITINLPL